MIITTGIVWGGLVVVLVGKIRVSMGPGIEIIERCPKDCWKDRGLFMRVMRVRCFGVGGESSLAELKSWLW